MKIKLEIKNRFTGKVLFSFEKESNTMKETVEKAIEDGANLVRANLYGANLDGANLYGANLYGANLDGANLYGANLDGANLDSANLDGANLDGANLVRANLPIYAKWSVAMKMTEERVIIIKIGCKEKTIEAWDKWFNSNDEYSTSRGTEDFKRIEGMYKAFKAYIEVVGIEILFPVKNKE